MALPEHADLADSRPGPEARCGGDLEPRAGAIGIRRSGRLFATVHPVVHRTGHWLDQPQRYSLNTSAIALFP